MALEDILANPGTPFQSAFLQSEQNRRAEAAFGLQQQLRKQSIAQNDLKLQAQNKQMQQAQQREDAIKSYKGDRRGLVDELYGQGDLEGASNIVQFETEISKLSESDQKAVRRKRDEVIKDTLDSSSAILEAGKRDPSGREMMQLAVSEGERFKRQYPQMQEQMPDFRGMHPQDVQAWWANKHNRSLANRKFDADQRYQQQKLDHAPVGKSEFERLDSLVNAGKATKAQRNRHNMLAGLVGREPTKGTQERFEKRLDFEKDKYGQVVSKDRRKATTAYRKEASADVKELESMDAAIKMGLKNIEIGGSLGSKNVKVALSQLAGSKVRALAQLQEFSNFGNIAERAVGLVTNMLSGGYSSDQLAMAKQIFEEMQQTIVNPGRKASKNYYRSLAKEQGLDPHNVAAYESMHEVRDDMRSGMLSRAQAKRIIQDNPNWMSQ